MEQKKLYVKPEETVVEMKMQQNLLTGSEVSGARTLDFTDTEELN